MLLNPFDALNINFKCHHLSNVKLRQTIKESVAALFTEIVVPMTISCEKYQKDG